MEPKKLTVEKIMLYPKALIIYGNKKCEVKSLYLNNNRLLVSYFDRDFNKTLEATPDAEDCKLILRPLRRLTEEERRFISNEYLIEVSKEDYPKLFTGIINLIRFCRVEMLISLIQHLKGLNIDIFGFLKSGEAVPSVIDFDDEF